MNKTIKAEIVAEPNALSSIGDGRIHAPDWSRIEIETRKHESNIALGAVGRGNTKAKTMACGGEIYKIYDFC